MSQVPINNMQDTDIYYESLRQVYEQMVTWKAPAPKFSARFLGWLSGITGVCFALSFIPVLPVILVYLGGRFDWVIDPLNLNLSDITIGKFIYVWLVSFLGTGVLFGLTQLLNNRIDPSVPTGPPQSLSPEQLTFIAIYESYKELKIFFVSHIDQHVEHSRKAFRKIIPGRRSWTEVVRMHGTSPTEEFHTPVMQLEDTRLRAMYPDYSEARWAASFPRQISIARSFLRTFEPFAWFQLDDSTKSILKALLSLQEKIPNRLKERTDLPAVLSILENLSKFTYAYLPEHKTYMESDSLKKLQQLGGECLQRFVEEINALTTISPPEQKKAQSDSHSLTLGEKYHYYYSQYVFFRFTLWFVLILLLTSGAVFLINQLVKLSADTMATVIIGTSVASAAALAGFLPKTSKAE